jgi:hypothetical protein
MEDQGASTPLPKANVPHGITRCAMNAGTAQQYARWIGALYLITIVAGGWGESHVPNQLLIVNDLAGTAHQVSRNLALLATCFGLMATAVYAAGELFYFAAALPAVDVDVARVISPEAKATLTYLCLTIYGYVNGIFAVFYGTATVVRGYLILGSGYLPRALGAIFIFGGASFIVKNFLVVVLPQYDLPYVIAPLPLALVSMALWLLIKGIDRPQWDQSRRRRHLLEERAVKSMG